jgi:hypothetical protein
MELRIKKVIRNTVFVFFSAALNLPCTAPFTRNIYVEMYMDKSDPVISQPHLHVPFRAPWEKNMEVGTGGYGNCCGKKLLNLCY